MRQRLTMIFGGSRATRPAGRLGARGRAFWYVVAILISLGGLLAGLPAAQATNSRPELEAVLRDLLAWLPGEYSSVPQVELERRLGAPPDGEHDEQYRRFTRIEAPHLGPYVLYGEIHMGGPDGPIVQGQQVLYIVSIDEAHAAVTISGRRIADAARYVGAGQRPEVWAELKPDPAYGGNCDFRWQRHGTQIVGRLADRSKTSRTCTHQSRTSGQWMRWDAEWLLSAEELWVFDNGYLLDAANLERPGRLFVGREDLTHERLYKARRFDCSGTGLASTSLLDRGGDAKPSLPSGARTLRLVRGPTPVEGGRLEERLSLSLRDAAGKILATRQAPGSATQVTLQGEEGRWRCSAARAPQGVRS